MIAILMLFQIVCIGAVPLSAPLLALSPSSVDPQTKYIKVKPTLQIADSNYANVFAIGDVADTGAHKAARPGMSQAKVASHNIEMLIKGKTRICRQYHADTPGIGLIVGICEFIAVDRFPGTYETIASIRKSDSGIRLRLMVNRLGDRLSSRSRPRVIWTQVVGKWWDRRAPGVKDYDL